jgi:hypothetical protein
MVSFLDRLQGMLRTEVGCEYLVITSLHISHILNSALFQLIELRLFLAIVQVNFFLDALPGELNTWKSRENLTNHPAQCYVRPIPWEKMENDLAS